MARTKYRTVHLAAATDGTPGPADGHDVSVAHAWVWVAKVDGELLTYDGDDPPSAVAALERVKGRADWAEYCEDEEDVYRYVGGVSNPEEDFRRPSSLDRRGGRPSPLPSPGG